MSELPVGWAEARLGDLGVWSGGGTPSKQVSSFWTGDIPWVSPKDMKVERIRDTIDHISPQAVEQSATNLVPASSVLVVTRSGILSHLLPVAVTERKVALNQDLKALVPADGVVSDYVAWALRSAAQDILRDCSKAGTTVSNIDTPKLLNFSIPLAPLNEQRRIVAAVEEHLSRLAAAAASLNHADLHCSALERVFIDNALTGDWETVALKEVTASQIYGTSAKADGDASGVPVLRMGNIQRGRLDLGALKYLPADHPDVAKLSLEPGDVLFNRTNSSELVGKSAVFAVGERMTFASYLIRVRLNERCDPHWAVLVINGPPGRNYVASVRTQQVGQANVNGTKLAAMPIPLPPIEEQRRIVAEIEERLGAIDALRAAIERAQLRGAALRRLILERAFRGALVPQDPSDEPASALLDRIRAERDRAGRGNRRAGSRMQG